MAIQIRRASPADIEAIQRVASRAWHEAHAPIIGEDTVEEFLNDYYDTESFEAEIDADETVFAVAVDESDDAPVGFVSARPDDEDPEIYHLGRIYVLPDRWGEGVGRRLLSHAEEQIEARDGERVRLAVMAENDRAVAFYESADYERVGEFYDERIATRSYDYEKKSASDGW